MIQGIINDSCREVNPRQRRMYKYSVNLFKNIVNLGYPIHHRPFGIWLLPDAKGSFSFRTIDEEKGITHDQI